MKKYFFDLLYIGSIILALMLLFTNASFPQSNVLVKPGEVIKLSWLPSGESDIWQYAVFYCQGSDTLQFPFNTGTDPDSLAYGEAVSNWSYAKVYDLKFFLEPKNIQGITYLRLGVSAINQAGKLGLIKCISKVITVKRPSILPIVKIQ